MTSDSNSDYKKTLLARLLDGVKGCQSRFGSRSELATEDERAVAKLCAVYEDVFSHGVKKANQQSSSSKTAFWVPAVLRPSDVASFWPLVKCQLSKHEAERFLLLHNVRTDVGRCRAWIRASLNEHSLERYILIILSLDNLQDYYEPWAFIRDHELNAILPQTAAGLGSVFFALTVDNPALDSLTHVMEKDIPEAITSVVEAQDSIEVADQAILALSPSSLAQTVPAALAKPLVKSSASPASEDKSTGKTCKKKKKKPPVHFVSFDDDVPSGSLDSANVSTFSVYSSLPSTASSTSTDNTKFHSFQKLTNEKDSSSCDFTRSEAPDPSSGTVNCSNMERNMMVDEEREFDNIEGRSSSPTALNVKDSENDSSEPSAEVPVISMSSGDNDNVLNAADASLCSTSVKSVDCISVNSVYSDCSERLDLECVSLAGLEISPSQRLKPMADDMPGHSSRDSSSGNPDFSHDLIPVPSYDSSVAQALHLDVEPQCGLSSSSKMQSPATPTTPGRVGGANIDVSQKDHLVNSTSAELTDEAVHKLKAILDREIESVAALRSDLAEEKRNSSNQIKMLEAKIESLSKENEILRHQLKKYVGAVQLLKREGSRRMSMENDDTVANNCTQAELDESTHEAAEYERKLIQVAEMHGELMEFNSHLQKTIQRKDTAIKRLKEELIDLRGPLATSLLCGEDEEDDDSWDIVESFSSAETSRSRSATATARRLAGSHHSNERVLINIWIPSAFLTGATNDLHHVYQVFVRIKDTEWNIYRRYSQFYSLHRELSKNDPTMAVISSLYFPPKKHLGNKDAKFVDERRRKLQEYLRAVMNHTLQSNSILASHPEKNLLISILPFFGESFNAQTPKPKRERSRTRSLFFRQSAQPSQPTVSGQLQFSNYPQYTGL